MNCVEKVFRQFKYHKLFKNFWRTQITIHAPIKNSPTFCEFLQKELELEELPSANFSRHGNFFHYIWKLNLDSNFKEKLNQFRINHSEIDISSEDIFVLTKFVKLIKITGIIIGIAITVYRLPSIIEAFEQFLVSLKP